jgi:monoterpene epsilon-lactone hydrolase
VRSDERGLSIDQLRQSGIQAKRGRSARRVRYYCAALALGTFWFVAARRLLKGPRHPGWGFRYELIATTLRVIQQRILRMPMAQLRQHTLSTRVHASLRERVAHERTSFAGMYAEIFTPRDLGEETPTILYFHGGGYISCSPASHRDLISRIAVESGARCIVVDYRKAPEYPFPAPIDDCEAAYRALVGEGVAPARIFLAGDSAGGALVLAVLLRVLAAGLPMPAAGVLLSPWVDLSRTGESVEANAAYDYLTPAALEFGVRHYLQGQDPMHPLASPVHAELHGLPPLLLLTGSAELFLSENMALAARARAHGVELTHHIQPGMVHVSSLFAGLVPNTGDGLALIGAFVREHTGARRLVARAAHLQAVHG